MAFDIGGQRRSELAEMDLGVGRGEHPQQGDHSRPLVAPAARPPIVGGTIRCTSGIEMFSETIGTSMLSRLKVAACSSKRTRAMRCCRSCNYAAPSRPHAPGVLRAHAVFGPAG